MSAPNNLFDSDEEEENYDDFKIRPQYQGPHGQQILELNSQLSKRFKLDERFAEDFEHEAVEEDYHSQENEERKKNIRILETVLGHGVVTKPSNKNFKKKQVRFDPDDENASKLIKAPDIVCEKQKSKKKKEVVKEKVEQNVFVSPERYIEVCPNLKEILTTATPFSFSQKFNNNAEPAEDSFQNGVPFQITKESKSKESENKSSKMDTMKVHNQCALQFIPKSKCENFFFTEKDPRLKEGTEFFKMSKRLEEIRILWQKRREHVLELFRKKRRSSQRSHSTRVQSMQIKNKIRRNNFKK